MVAVAEYRGCSVVQLRGDANFRREAWIEARRRGLAVRGYDPTPRDLQLEARRQPSHAEPTPERKPKPMSPERRTAIVEAVIAGRMLDPDRARRLIEAARARLAPLSRDAERTRHR